MAARAFAAEPLDTLELRELCLVCGVSAELVIDLMDEGIVEPVGRSRRGPLFTAVAVRRVQIVRRLQRDLGVNRAGAGLAMELIDELQRLRRRVALLEARDGIEPNR
ncbi:chaperone modulator CbpM [Spectribacter hydrogenooxidans]|uniref:Chaperone modulator CbpM n=1 Tax=Spectribacter hydrogenoxidans TaxID=3075608 RepID=A0ABU3C046_9GAMM|nr:chaperone modulator CbpM [Salinisphaera sp. W335]MDT0634915.1 chaperone modulator CbpM [Salinisphaera sp. W335]